MNAHGTTSAPGESTTGAAPRHGPLCCDDCGHVFLARPDDKTRRCTRCGSPRCQPVRRQVAGTTRSADIPVEEDRFARLALWGSLITSHQFAACVAEQKRRAVAGETVPSLPQLLIDRGYLCREHADAVLRATTTRTPEQWRNQFGQIALRKGFVTEAQLRECLEEQTRMVLGAGSAPILGHLLLERGYMTDKQVAAILRVQAQRQLGALHQLEAALRPRRARLAAVARRHRTPLAALAVAVGLLAVVLVGNWVQGLAAAPRTYELMCDHCGHRARLAADAFARPCPRCGRGQVLTPLRCTACGVDFPLKIHTAAQGRHWIEPCPRCGTLDHVHLPEALPDLRAHPPPAQP